MITLGLLIFGFMVLFGAIGICFSICGSILMALFWVFVKLPVAFVIFALGLAFCCTIILIPVGVILIKAAVGIIF